MTCISAGTADPELTGLGIIVATTTQSGLSILLSCYTLLFLRRSNTRFSGSQPTPVGIETESQAIINRILLCSSDAQTMTGIALCLAAMGQWKTIGLYQARLLFCILSILPISILAALGFAFPFHIPHSRRRHLAITSFMVLYIIYTSLIVGRFHGIHNIEGWNLDLPGHCYNFMEAGPRSLYIIRSFMGSAGHPTADYRAFALVGLFVLVTVLGAQLCQMTRWNYTLRIVVEFSYLAYPACLWTIGALKQQNEGIMETDQGWSRSCLGQIFCLLLLMKALLECGRGMQQYFANEEEAKTASSIANSNSGSQISHVATTVRESHLTRYGEHSVRSPTSPPPRRTTSTPYMTPRRRTASTVSHFA